MRVRFATFVFAATVAFVASVSFADDKADVMKVIRQYVERFNNGDPKSAELCTDHTVIIDEFPPHTWAGPNACLSWMQDYDVDAKKHGISDGHVTLGKPRVLDLDGDRAYAVIPSNYNFKRNGKPVAEKGASFTFALQKGPEGWRIIGWSWAKA